jgi:hypothetical protein
MFVAPPNRASVPAAGLQWSLAMMIGAPGWAELFIVGILIVLFVAPLAGMVALVVYLVNRRSSSSPPPDRVGRIQCRECGGWILPEAVNCRFCGARFDNPQS